MSLSSLYDGVGFDESSRDGKGLHASKIAGWSDNLQFMKTQLQLRKASSKAVPPVSRTGKGSLTASGPGSITLSNMTGGTESKTVLIDEYNPLRPNNYSDYKERAREEQERKDRDKEEDRRRRRSPSPHDRDESKKKRREDEKLRDRGRAAIAPPASLLETTPVNPDLISKKDGAGTGGFQTGNVVASQIMAKYGWKEGQGLGREEQGLSTCLQVEKTGKRAGKIINKDVEKIKKKERDDFIAPAPPPLEADDITDRMKNPSKVVLLMNMVGPGEVDDDLQPEIEEECTTKYGDINKVIIFEIPGAIEEEAVRIFVEFKRIESAVKALVDLNGRFFGGRSVSARFYNLDRFRRLDLAD